MTEHSDMKDTILFMMGEICKARQMPSEGKKIINRLLKKSIPHYNTDFFKRAKVLLRDAHMILTDDQEYYNVLMDVIINICKEELQKGEPANITDVQDIGVPYALFNGKKYRVVDMVDNDIEQGCYFFEEEECVGFYFMGELDRTMIHGQF